MHKVSHIASHIEYVNTTYGSVVKIYVDGLLHSTEHHKPAIMTIEQEADEIVNRLKGKTNNESFTIDTWVKFDGDKWEIMPNEQKDINSR